MKLPDFELVSPTTVMEACGYLEAGRDDAQVIAGGTDLMIALKEGQKQPKVVVDISGVPGLDVIDYSDDEGLSIGAMATLQRLARHPAVAKHYPVLVKAAHSVGSPQLRGMGTIAGNLCQDSCCMYFNRPKEVRAPLPPCHKLGGCVCHVVSTSPKCWAPYAGDMAPALMALGATVDIAERNGEKTMPVGGIYSEDGARPIVLEKGQMITRINCPPPVPHAGTVYIKLRARGALDYATAGVAARIVLDRPGGVCTEAAVVLTGVASFPMAVPEAAELKGGDVGESAIADVASAALKLAYPVKNVVGTDPAYRRNMVVLNVGKALREAHRLAGGS